MTSNDQRDALPVAADHVEAVVEFTRLLAWWIAGSQARLEPGVTMPQWRVMVLASRGGCNVTAVAEDLGVHMSNASRVCERLVEAGLLQRRRAEHDRRHVVLELTPAGERLFDDAMDYRRQHIEAAMSRMTPEDSATFARVVNRFREAASHAGRGLLDAN